jgi:threonine/homoserine/homoserine lactone efflux protein
LSGGGASIGEGLGMLVGAVVAIIAVIVMTIVGVVQLRDGHHLVGSLLLLPAAIVVCFLAWAGLRSSVRSMGRG